MARDISNIRGRAPTRVMDSASQSLENVEYNDHKLDSIPHETTQPNQAIDQSEPIGADDIEDDQVIVLEADNEEFFNDEMIQYFERSVGGSSIDRGLGLPQNNDGEEAVCRICLGEEEDAAKNPLFRPCACAGSMGLIHLECLKEWLQSKKV